MRKEPEISRKFNEPDGPRRTVEALPPEILRAANREQRINCRKNEENSTNEGVRCYLEVNVRDDKQLVEIWLTNAEKKDPALREGLKDIYKKCKQKKYMVAVFESGEKDLYQGTLDLLAYNKRRCAELEVKREKKKRTAALER